MNNEIVFGTAILRPSDIYKIYTIVNSQYKYYNMDQVAAAALTFSKSISENYKA